MIKTRTSVEIDPEDMDLGYHVGYDGFVKYSRIARKRSLEESGFSDEKFIETGLMLVAYKIGGDYRQQIKADEMGANREIEILSRISYNGRARIIFYHGMYLRGDPEDSPRVTIWTENAFIDLKTDRPLRHLRGELLEKFIKKIKS